MKILTYTDYAQLPPCVATIGFFDGVHRGHLYLIQQLIKEAHQSGLASLLITFPIHPRQVMQSEFCPKLLSTQEEKRALLSQTEADYCIELPFTKALAALTAREFMKEILYQKLNVRTLLVGYDHRFGKGRSEGFEAYQAIGRELGMEVVEAYPLTIESHSVSSSAVRLLLQEGEIELATQGLGRYYALSGEVVRGFGVGRTLGFPTANIAVADCGKLIPPMGVYAVYVKLEGQRYPGMLNIGIRPTIDNGDQQTIEAHLLDYEGDLYGKELKIEFVRRLREEQKFSSRNALLAQIQKDEQTTRELFTR